MINTTNNHGQVSSINKLDPELSSAFLCCSICAQIAVIQYQPGNFAEEKATIMHYSDESMENVPVACMVLTVCARHKYKHTIKLNTIFLFGGPMDRIAQKLTYKRNIFAILDPHNNRSENYCLNIPLSEIRNYITDPVSMYSVSTSHSIDEPELKSADINFFFE